MNSELVRLDALSVSFGGIRALKDVSLSLPGSSLTSLIGPNGAGKTTLLNCICGLYQPDSGGVFFKGESITRLSPVRIARLGIARTFQNIELFRNMTALENILLGRHIHYRAGLLRTCLRTPGYRTEETAHRRKAEEIIGFLEIEWARERRVADLPIGTQRLVDLGRALATEPALLLLDEPGAGMTPEEKEELIFRIKDIHEEFGATIVLVEHDLRMVMGLSHRVIVLNEGRTIADGPPDQVGTNPEVVKAYLGE